MKKLLVLSAKVLISLLILLAFLEVGLRLAPRLVPLALLVDFQEAPRAEIARRAGLPTINDTTVLERDDGGPPLRIFKPFTTVTFKRDDAGAPKTVQMDGLGFCNPPGTDYEKGRFDIVAIGDSFTWCQSVLPEEAWASRLSGLLDRPVYNLGRAGIGLHEYIQILKKFGVQKSPRFVVMNVYEGNDLRDAVHYHMYLGTDWGQRNPRWGSGPCTSGRRSSCLLCSWLGKLPLVRSSYALNLAAVAADRARSGIQRGLATLSSDRRKREPKPNFRYRVKFPGAVVAFNPSNTDSDEITHAKCLHNGEIGFDVFTGALQEFIRLSQRHGFTPVVAYSPSAYTVYAENVTFDDPALADLLRAFSGAQRDYFKTKAAELGYVFVDLTPSLQAAARSHGAGELLYYPGNLHFTARGHRVVAETLTDALGRASGAARKN